MRQFACYMLAVALAAAGFSDAPVEAAGPALAPTTGSAAGVVDVRSHGARGDGVADDTAAVQAAIDAAGLSGGTVLFPPGTYLVTSVGLRPGVVYSGYGATIKRPPNQSKWVRTFDAMKPGYFYSGDADSAPLVIEGFVFDGNREEQGPYAGYQLEQAHLLFLAADPAKPGRLQARVRDCAFHDAVADAVSVNTNVDLQLRDCTARDCFRGGLVVTGGASRVQADNLIARGATHATGIDIEVDVPGYGGTHKVEVTLNNVLLPDGDFDVAVSDGSVVLANNVFAAAPFNLNGGGDSTIRCGGCVLGVGRYSSGGNRIVNPGDVTFSDCRFYVDAEPAHNLDNKPVAGPGAGAVTEPAAEPGAPSGWACAHLYWWVSSEEPPARQSLTFADCEFRVGPGVAPADTTYAVYAEADQTGGEGRTALTIDGGRIAEEFDYGVFLNLGGRAVVKDVEVGAATAFRFGSQAGYALGVLLDGVRVDAARTYLDVAAAGADSDAISHRNVVVDEAANVLVGELRRPGLAPVGGRVVLGRAAPTAATHGLPGDVYRLKAPAAGSVYEWACTAGGSGEGAVWKPLSRIGE